MKESSLIHPKSVMVINEPSGKPSGNFERYFLPLKIATGGLELSSRICAGQKRIMRHSEQFCSISLARHLPKSFDSNLRIILGLQSLCLPYIHHNLNQ
jgi:hypothetical protein